MREMDIRGVLARLAAAFEEAGVEYALIGGLALGAHGAGRATVDLDFLAAGEHAEEVDRILGAAGYACLQRTENVANYVSDDPALGRVDFLFTRRDTGLAMLARAQEHGFAGTEVPVVDASDLIGLKVQGYSNDSRRRHADLADIQKLLRLAPELDLDRVRSYFRLFDREKDLESLLEGIRRQ